MQKVQTMTVSSGKVPEAPTRLRESRGGAGARPDETDRGTDRQTDTWEEWTPPGVGEPPPRPKPAKECGAACNS